MRFREFGEIEWCLVSSNEISNNSTNTTSIKIDSMFLLFHEFLTMKIAFFFLSSQIWNQELESLDNRSLYQSWNLNIDPVVSLNLNFVIDRFIDFLFLQLPLIWILDMVDVYLGNISSFLLRFVWGCHPR